jgi:hypothetical protein
MFSEAESNRLADATSPARHQRYFIVQTKSAHSVAPLLQPAKKMKWPPQRFIGREYPVSTIKIVISLFEIRFDSQMAIHA